MANEQHDFEKAYARGFKPWDSGQPCAGLVRVLDAGLLPGSSLLEIGCGTGTNAIEFARRGFRVTAVDFVPQAVAAAQEKIRAAGVQIDVKVGDATCGNLGGPYDVVFDRGVYHHIRTVNLRGLLETIERATRPGSRWLSLAGNAKEQHNPGPPTVSEAELREELGGLFEILELREFRFTTDASDFQPLAWSILMQRK